MEARDYFNRLFRDISEIQKGQQVGHYAGLTIEANGDKRMMKPECDQAKSIDNGPPVCMLSEKPSGRFHECWWKSGYICEYYADYVDEAVRRMLYND